MKSKVVVLGAGGVVGGLLIPVFEERGQDVLAVDTRPISDWSSGSRAAKERIQSDASDQCLLQELMGDDPDVVHLACPVGNNAYIRNHALDCAMAVKVTLSIIEAWRTLGSPEGVRVLYLSSSCVYPQRIVNSKLAKDLDEDDAVPSDPEPGYGWEKLFSEHLLDLASREGLEPRIARWDNCFGPESTFAGGAEKAPSALARKVAECSLGFSDQLEVWGDGSQVRTFLFTQDAVDLTMRILDSEYSMPFNVAGDRGITVEEMAATLLEIANVGVPIVYLGERRGEDGALITSAGVQRRVCSMRRARSALAWHQSISMEEGLRLTYEHVRESMANG